jgi:thioredoxin reductase (NADPH)
MTKSSKSPDKTDVLIIGGGPAGLSAFKWCAELGMSAILVEGKGEFGGQLLSIHNPITNYLGRTAANGREMLGHFLSQIDGLETGSILNATVVEFDAKKIAATLSNGRIIQARAAIIATGVRRRRLNVPGEREFAGRGILESGALDKASVKGKRVAIIGGGDAALENALILSEFAEKVYVIHRRSEFSARPEFVKPASNHPKIEFVLNSVVTELKGTEALSVVELRTGNSTRTINVDAALIRIGVQPNSDIFSGTINMNSSGYVEVDETGATNIADVFAAGDVVFQISQTLQSSTGSASTAVKTIFALVRKGRNESPKISKK